MKITSAKFIKGAMGSDDIFISPRPQIVFVGRSNVGKSSTINSLVGQKDLAKTSSFPGRTQQINIYLINNDFYLIDLPGYGFADVPLAVREQLAKMVNWYLFESGYRFQKVVVVIDSKIGPTPDDMNMVNALEGAGKDIVIVANKVDKLKKLELETQIQKIRNIFGFHPVVPYSAEKKIGIGELVEVILAKKAYNPPAIDKSV